MGIDPNEMATALTIKDGSEFTVDWFAEEDYPEDHKRVYFEERVDWSQTYQEKMLTMMTFSSRKKRTF